MVRVGFIVEGDTEKIVIDSAPFKTWAAGHGLEVCHPVIDAKGGGNLLPNNIEPMIQTLRAVQLDHIIILTDQEDAPNPETVRQRIGTTHTNLIFIAVKAIEAWFLADSTALGKWLESKSVHEAKPEQTPGMPWLRLKEIAEAANKRGPGSSKPQFALRMVKHYGFSIANAAKHPACPSVKHFHDELVRLGRG